jgi:hypothetical protein
MHIEKGNYKRTCSPTKPILPGLFPATLRTFPFCDLNNLIGTVLWFQNGLLHLSGSIVTKFVAGMWLYDCKVN